MEYPKLRFQLEHEAPVNWGRGLLRSAVRGCLRTGVFKDAKSLLKSVDRMVAEYHAEKDFKKQMQKLGHKFQNFSDGVHCVNCGINLQDWIEAEKPGCFHGP